MPKWFVRIAAKEQALDWILEQTAIINQPEIKNIMEKTEFIYRDLVEKKGLIAGIQKNVCLCGRAHDEFAVIARDILEKEAWKDKERLTLICKECQEVFLMISELYGIEKAKKVMNFLWAVMV